MQRKKYDIIIVGSGLAGLMLARQLNDSQLSILLIEQNDSINKTRAGIYGCFRYVPERLGLSKYFVKEHDGLQLYGQKNKTSFFFKEKPFVTIDMTRWAKDLRLKCDKKLNTKIISILSDEDGYTLVDNKNKKYSGRLIVDCTGHWQTISNLLGVKRSKRQYYNASFELTNCNIPKERQGDVGVGYDHTNSNMGVWFYLYNQRSCQFGVGNIVKSVDEVIPEIVSRLKKSMNQPLYKDWFKNSKIEKITTGIGPTLSLHKPIVKDNFISLGDAAGMGIPFTGEGLRFHLEMADYASQIIYESFCKNDLRKSSFRSIRKYFDRKYKKGFFYCNLLQAMCLRYIEPDTADDIIKNINEKWNKKDIYDLAYGKMKLDSFLRMFSVKIIFKIFINIINFHLPISLRFKKIEEMRDYERKKI